MAVKTIICTFLALIAFAANSVLCRLALGDGAIDAASFTITRLLSGVVVLLAIMAFNKSSTAASTKGSWTASIMLFIYALAFSYAYSTLGTGTGALILFGAVQITMILASVINGSRLHYSEWLGVFIAFFGLVYLIFPEVSTPSAVGFGLMALSGIAWGVYTLKGKESKNPLVDTAYNFFRTIPFVLVLLVFTINEALYTYEGILLATISGGLTSAIGYTIWYIALKGLTSTQAAVLQLSVPLIAALGGILFVSEAITYRFSFSALLVLGGIIIVFAGKHIASKQKA